MRHMLIATVWLMLGFVGATNARAEPPRLTWPVACVMGDDCYIQNYVDIDPSPRHRDFGCGWLTYDGTKGTDIALRGYDAMRDGYPVLAAADGIVKGVRDGMRDVNLNDIDRNSLRGRFAGNSVIIDHGDGWETQYNHMLRGSVAVRPGEQVRSGQRLGLVGLSGQTAFPHLDFAVRQDGAVLDPFIGLGSPPDCGAARPAKLEPLWADTARDTRGKAVAYDPGGLVRAGFATQRFDTETALTGLYDKPIDRNSPVILVWAIWYGGQQGDVDRIRLTAPNGETLADHAITRKTPGARRSIYSGARRPATGWPSGQYTLEITVRRASDDAFVSHRKTTEVR